MSILNALQSALTADSDVALLRITAEYEPAGGPSSKVYPPTYPADREGNQYVLEQRHRDGALRPSVLLDGVPSQANRAEEALLAAHRSGLMRVPQLSLQYSGEGGDVELSSLEFPHRFADAYARDSLVGDVPFDRSDVGKAMLASSLADARGLFAHDPGSLVFGAWNSHRKGRQQKFPRCYVSEVVGWDPELGQRRAGRMDPMNLVGAAKPAGDGNWEYATTGDKSKGTRLSEIGHGNIAPNPAHGGVTISGATRLSSLSFAALRRIRFGAATEEAQHAARVAIATYALAADRLAFAAPSLWLRSTCELVLKREDVQLVSRGGVVEDLTVTTSDAVAAFEQARDLAAGAGIAMTDGVVVLTPKPALAKAIDFALTKAESTD